MVMGDLPTEAQVVVLGGGPGGYAAAFRAADLGLDVTLVTEEERLGGTCLLRGCVPSKTLLSVADLVQDARRSGERGVGFGEPEIDLGRLRGWRDDVVGRLARGLDRLAESRGVKVVGARGRFRSGNELHLEGGSGEGTLRFRHAVIATGSVPSPLPDVEFGPRILDSAGALELRDVPDRLLVLGAGYVGLEMGTVYAALGSGVTVIEQEDRILPLADRDLAEVLEGALQNDFGEIRLETTVEEVSVDQGGVRIRGTGPDGPVEIEGDRLLVAVGRYPATDDLGLERTDVEVDDRGAVLVDEKRRTSDERIFAVGDATGGEMLAHEAMLEGKVAAEAIAGEPTAFDPRAIPAVVYTAPQVAWCGLTERSAESDGIEVEVVRFPWKASGRALSIGAGDGFTKLVVDPETHRILGMGMVGPHVESLVAEGVLAVEMGGVARDLARSIHPHPTLSETVAEAAELLLGGATHLGPRQGG